MYKPLADKLRPASLSEVYGQKHILGENGILKRIIESANIPNMIFYGPSGTGKTTVAGIIADRTRRRLYRLNATTASISDIKQIIDETDTMLAPEGVLLYLDEIQYFNKKQQQSLLEFMENGKITLIASTTENPYFYIYNAVLSRSTIFEFYPVAPEDVILAVRRAFSVYSSELSIKARAEEGVFEYISLSSGGDVRKAINSVEMLLSASPLRDGVKIITMDDTRQISQCSSIRYDRDGDSHYDILSAFHKSLRGSDPDAALHYLARLLEGGDIPSACRRLLAAASEDIGLAYPQAVSIVKACVDSALQLGLPEARLPLAQATLLLSTAPKSNSVVTAIDGAISDLRAGNYGDVPLHLKDSNYKNADKLGRGISYKYPHNFENNWVKQDYLPSKLLTKKYYTAGKNKAERQAREYWEKIKNSGG